MLEPGPLLSVESVDAGYGALQVLWGVTLSVNSGEIVSLIGANGAGKTTVIKTILGLVPVRHVAAEGAIRFKGERIDALAPEEIVKLGVAVVPEGARVFPDMSVLDNLYMGSLIPRARARESTSLAEGFALFP